MNQKLIWHFSLNLFTNYKCSIEYMSGTFFNMIENYAKSHREKRRSDRARTPCCALGLRRGAPEIANAEVSSMSRFVGGANKCSATSSTHNRQFRRMNLGIKTSPDKTRSAFTLHGA